MWSWVHTLWRVCCRYRRSGNTRTSVDSLGNRRTRCGNEGSVSRSMKRRVRQRQAERSLGNAFLWRPPSTNWQTEVPFYSVCSVLPVCNTCVGHFGKKVNHLKSSAWSTSCRRQENHSIIAGLILNSWTSEFCSLLYRLINIVLRWVC